MIKIILGSAVLLLLILVVGATLMRDTSTAVKTSQPPAVAENTGTSSAGEGVPQPVGGLQTSDESAYIVDLSGQGLTRVSDVVFRNTDTEELNLANNALSGSLPGEIRFLQNLKVLNLSNNQFTGVPAEIGQLQNLEVLDLSNNGITGLPSELGNLRNLKILNVSGNDYSAADLAGIQAQLPSTVQIVAE